jgi:hypothetical protein
MEININYRKMMEKRLESISHGLRTGLLPLSSKENTILTCPVTLVPKSPTRFIKSQSIQSPGQTFPSYPTHWATSTGYVSATRVLSPNAVLATVSTVNGRRPDFI